VWPGNSALVAPPVAAEPPHATKGFSGKPPLPPLLLLLLLGTAQDLQEVAGVIAPALSSLLSKEAWLLEVEWLLLVSVPVPGIVALLWPCTQPASICERPPPVRTALTLRWLHC